MIKTGLQFTLIFSIVVLVYSFSTAKLGSYGAYVETAHNGQHIDPNMSVEDALMKIGDEKPLHYIPQLDVDSARMGEEIVKYGKLMDGSNKRVSKYFVCTDCHNLKMESADPADESPEAVLTYSRENDIPFLPASTFYGMYNKRHWYNGDYYKKYGTLVLPTRDTLYNAIQLCATQCAQGREMDHWEVRTVLHYYKSLEYKIGDLNFSRSELDKFGELLASDKTAAQKMLKKKYSEANGATFGTSEIPKIEGYKPRAEVGEYIFNKGCLHCHDATTGITNFTLSDTKLSHGFLHRKKNKYNHYAVPHITRYGTYAISGRKQYMPMYSFEKMSNEQLLDLLHYIETKANE